MGGTQSSETDIRRLIVTSVTEEEVKEHMVAFFDRPLTEFEEAEISKVISQRDVIGAQECEEQLGNLIDYFSVKEVNGPKEVASVLDIQSIIGHDESDSSMLESPSPSSISVGLPQLVDPQPKQALEGGGAVVDADAIRRMRNRLRAC